MTGMGIAPPLFLLSCLVGRDFRCAHVQQQQQQQPGPATTDPEVVRLATLLSSLGVGNRNGQTEQVIVEFLRTEQVHHACLMRAFEHAPHICADTRLTPQGTEHRASFSLAGLLAFAPLLITAPRRTASTLPQRHTVCMSGRMHDK